MCACVASAKYWRAKFIGALSAALIRISAYAHFFAYSCPPCISNRHPLASSRPLRFGIQVASFAYVTAHNYEEQL
jgi:hypothetical protein